MKLLKAAIALGTLAHVSQGVALKIQIADEHLTTADSHLVERASPSTAERVNEALEGAAALGRAANEVGATDNWFWWTFAVVDATADLVADIVTDAAQWSLEAAEGTGKFIGNLVGDADEFINRAVEDARTWRAHYREDEFSEIADDLHAWVADIRRILTENLRVAADGSIVFIGEVSDDIGEWITEYARDHEMIADQTYCFEAECPDVPTGLAQKGRADQAANLKRQIVRAFRHHKKP